MLLTNEDKFMGTNSWGLATIVDNRREDTKRFSRAK